MKKYIKKHLKDEKRILKLMYRKGIFELLRIEFKSLGWEYLYAGKNKRKRKNGNQYAFREYLPELHTFWSDYWGEGDSRSVISSFRDYLLWELATDTDEMGWPINNMDLSKKGLIFYLQKLPTINKDSKFNIYLKNDGRE